MRRELAERVKTIGPSDLSGCIKNDTNLKDGFVEVKFKPVSGKKIKPAA